MPKDSNFNARLRASAPVHSDETPEYKSFNAAYRVAFPLAFVVLAYVTFFIFGGQIGSAMALGVSKFSVLQPRIEFLKAHDQASAFAYAATVASGLFLLPILILFHAVAYWKTVIGKRRCRPADGYTLLGVGLVVFMVVIMMAIAFVHVPKSYDPRWPGMARILFWPIFPVFGGVAFSILEEVGFITFVGLMKLVWCKGDEHE